MAIVEVHFPSCCCQKVKSHRNEIAVHRLLKGLRTNALHRSTYISIPRAMSPLATDVVAVDKDISGTPLSAFISREPGFFEGGGSSTGNVGENRALLEKAAVTF